MSRRPRSRFSGGRDSEIGLNVGLAAMLRDRLPRWECEAERSRVMKGEAGRRPDMVARASGGLPVVIETELEPARTVEGDARGRLGKVLAQDGARVEQAIAVRYPAEVAFGAAAGAGERLQKATLSFCVISGPSPEGSARWPADGWIEGGIDDLAACIEHVALSEDLIDQGMTALEEGVSEAAVILMRSDRQAKGALTDIARELHQERGEQTARMAMAIIANAMTFHTALEGVHGGIPPLDTLLDGRGRVSKSLVRKTWKNILDINYWPIFEIALKVLDPIRAADAPRILNRLAQVAAELAGIGATSQQDLGGRMFQQLITDRKFLATFYTLPSSAALLAELAVARLDVDWSDAEAVTGIRIADFACGTGALLGAAYGAVLRRHRWSGGDDEEVHARMMESVLVGADIMPAATHLTAAMLSSAHPGVRFDDTSIITLPYGEWQMQGMDGGDSRSIAIGALDLIGDQMTFPLLETGQDRRRASKDGRTEPIEIKHKSFDLVIMNPPFTRPTNHEATDVPVPSFAGFETSRAEQTKMKKRLKELHEADQAGHGNAGIASNFIDVADVKVKDGGTIALVLPAAFLQGDGWDSARALLKRRYRDIVVVSIAATGSTDRAFSADTGMAEVLVLATRRDGRGEGKDGVLFVSLARRPDSILDAAAAAREISAIVPSRRRGALTLGTDAVVGSHIRGQWSEMGCGGVENVDLAEAVKTLVKGHLQSPRRAGGVALPVVGLRSLGNRGRLHRDINGKSGGGGGLPRGPFDIQGIEPGGVPTYPVLWRHNARRETRLVVEPDRQGVVREGCDERAVQRWAETASMLHFTLDFRLNSQPLAACMTPGPSMGGRAWPNFVCDDPRWERALALWANTTLGVIAFWWIGSRQHQGRATITISRLPDLTVLDARILSPKQLDLADSIFNNFAGRKLLPANEAWRDETRQDLDRAVLIDLLGLRPPKKAAEILDPLALLRTQWCAEPSVHGGKPTGPK